MPRSLFGLTYKKGVSERYSSVIIRMDEKFCRDCGTRPAHSGVHAGQASRDGWPSTAGTMRGGGSVEPGRAYRGRQCDAFRGGSRFLTATSGVPTAAKSSH